MRVFITLMLAAAAAVPTHLHAHKTRSLEVDTPDKVAACKEKWGGEADTDENDSGTHCCPGSCMDGDKPRCGGAKCADWGDNCCPRLFDKNAMCSATAGPPCIVPEDFADIVYSASNELTNANMIPNGNMDEEDPPKFPGFLNDCATSTSRLGSVEVSQEMDSSKQGNTLKLTSKDTDDYTMSYTTWQAANRCPVDEGKDPAQVIEWASKAGEEYEFTVKCRSPGSVEVQGESFLFNFNSEDHDLGVASEQKSSGWVKCSTTDWTTLTAKLGPLADDGHLRVRVDVNEAEQTLYFDDFNLVKTADPTPAARREAKA